jgi:hypothetical protein
MTGTGAFAGVPELRDATLQGFRKYAANVEAQSQNGLRSGNFLWIDDLVGKEKTAAYAKLKQGGVMVRRLSGANNGNSAVVPGGMIHDWQGIIFIPRAKLDQVLDLLQDYNNHATYYSPDVDQSRIESRDGNHFRVFMRFRRHKVLTVVLNTEQDITYFRDSPTRAHSRSTALRIREVANPGGPSETEKSPNDDNGFLWQMETWWRMEERDGGVYVQNESVTLTRDIPAGLGWLIEPFVTSIPQETLEFTLKATRNAVIARGENASRSRLSVRNLCERQSSGACLRLAKDGTTTTNAFRQ